jgi:hypothetical protein
MLSVTRVESAAGAALGYLDRRQAAAGDWHDYQLPVGASDAWVTAYTGFACQDAGRFLGAGSSRKAEAMAVRSAAWLRSHRAYPAGWGFNANTGPDCDSTAWALRLFRALGQVDGDTGDVEFLLQHWIPGAGFSTFTGPGAWGNAHMDVTPVAHLALPMGQQRDIEAQVRSCVWAGRTTMGDWPSYWWRRNHYATAMNADLLSQWGQSDGLALLQIDGGELRRLESTLDLACALLTASFCGGDGQIVEALVDDLLRRQKADGGWLGSDDLRVTDPECAAPWLYASGRRYADHNGLISTATALRALGISLRRGRQGGR